VELVVDSSALQSADLRSFLAASRQNRAVLTDYLGMEAYKANAAEVIPSRFAILMEFPQQAVVLRGTNWACIMRGRSKGLRRRLVDEDTTRHFPDHCKAIAQLKNGDKRLIQLVASMERTAAEQLDRLVEAYADFPGVVADISKGYTQSELAEIRGNNRAYSASTLGKFFENVEAVAEHLFTNHPSGPKWPKQEEVLNTFLFRTALASMLWVIRKIEKGGTPRSPEKLRNDIVDINYVVFATYFDGLLTHDQRQDDLFAEASFLLGRLRARRG
jgi:hypothetical protein